MSKKILIPISLVIVLAVAAGAIGTLAVAKASQPAAATVPTASGLKGGWGQVAATGQNQFTVKNKNGEYTLQVNAQTKFHAWNGEQRLFSDMQVNGWVMVSGSKQSDGSLLARQVILLPQGFDGSQADRRAAGSITSVDEAAGSFSLKTLKGQVLKVNTNASTVFMGLVKNLADLRTGLAASVAGIKQSDGSLLALIVAARQPLKKNAGKVTAVDAAASTLSIQSLKGVAITYRVDANTRFRSRAGQIKSLSEVKTGMTVLVQFRKQPNGDLLAKQVLVNVK